MAEATLQQIHQDIELIKEDMAQLKAALLNNKGQLSDWACERINNYLDGKEYKFISQEDIEKEFL